MPDKALTLEVLGQIENAAQKVVTRFETIRYPGDFTDSAAGVEKMDAICMMLIVIGESLKNLDKITECKLLPHYPEVDWKKQKECVISSLTTMPISMPIPCSLHARKKFLSFYPRLKK